jgi:phage pi2 protein 07
MLSLQLDEKALEEVFLQELKKRLDQIEKGFLFWDMKELCRQTKMSENNIKEKFFYDERFPKYKVGGKWIFPAAECEKFLLEWIREQPTN